jgi:hypothetical protein
MALQEAQFHLVLQHSQIVFSRRPLMPNILWSLSVGNCYGDWTGTTGMRTEMSMNSLILSFSISRFKTLFQLSLKPCSSFQAVILVYSDHLVQENQPCSHAPFV